MNDFCIFRSHGKINWFLGIGDRREDGYHEICSLMQKIALYDEIEVSLSTQDCITCNYSVPLDEGSLLKRTLTVLRMLYPRLTEVGFTITVKKRIPPGSGLGGGSSNAATLLRFLPSLLEISVSQEDLFAIAPELGSDVPFLLHESPFALVKGRGEKVIPLRHCPQRFLVLLFPSFSISTSWAYQKWDEEMLSCQSSTQSGKTFLQEFLKSEGEKIEKVIWNDFETLVFRYYPILGAYREKLMALGCQKVFMTGSGSTLVGVVESASKGQEIVRVLNRENIHAVLTSTLV